MAKAGRRRRLALKLRRLLKVRRYLSPVCVGLDTSRPAYRKLPEPARPDAGIGRAPKRGAARRPGRRRDCCAPRAKRARTALIPPQRCGFGSRFILPGAKTLTNRAAAVAAL